MCLAVPTEVVAIEGEMGTVTLSGVERQVNLSLLEDVTIGDFVLIHAGVAIEKLDPAEAAETLKLFDELEASYETPEPS